MDGNRTHRLPLEWPKNEEEENVVINVALNVGLVTLTSGRSILIQRRSAQIQISDPVRLRGQGSAGTCFTATVIQKRQYRFPLLEDEQRHRSRRLVQRWKNPC